MLLVIAAGGSDFEMLGGWPAARAGLFACALEVHAAAAPGIADRHAAPTTPSPLGRRDDGSDPYY